MKSLYKLIGIVNKIETAYRRINFPEIKRRDLVIDIGCGDLPNPRADIVCDFIDENTERIGDLKIDRPFIWANAQKLPFKDGSFDYSILSHVLEHVEDPAKVLDEVQRISKAGYIETPNSFYEFAVSHTYHLSRCTVKDGKLIVSLKSKWDERLGGERSDIDDDANKCWWNLHNLDAKALLTMYKWEGKIHYEVRGNKSFVKQGARSSVKEDKLSLRTLVKKLVYWLYKPKKKVGLVSILACPVCKGELITSNDLLKMECNKCHKIYSQHKGFFDFRV